jgi:hypothetical protein
LQKPDDTGRDDFDGDEDENYPEIIFFCNTAVFDLQSLA